MRETKTLDRPIYQMAELLGRRAQTIYGRQTVVDLCAKAGVSLMDFIIRYAKMSPAARLTVLVLAKQHGVSLSEEITKKRKHPLKDMVETLMQYLPKPP